MKRGVDEVFAANVENELKALMGLPTPPPVAAVPIPAAASIATVAAALPASPTPIAAVPAPPAPTVDGRNAFVALLSKASAAISAKKLTQEQLNSAVIAAGVPSLPLLANRLDLIPTVSATLDGMIAA
jgi:hypothetical protein